jgi:hypothetical protein
MPQMQTLLALELVRLIREIHPDWSREKVLDDVKG